MIRLSMFASLVFVAISSVVHGQGAGQPAPVQIRAVLHDPLNPIADLYYVDKSGSVSPVHFRSKDLSRPMSIIPLNGSLVFYDKANIDPRNPAASMAASAKLPAGMKSAIVVLLPSPKGKEQAYQMIVIDDSEDAFAGGESMVLPLVGGKLAVQAGEHALHIQPGKLTKIPAVKEVNQFNMAQTNFHYEYQGSWVAFTERQLQYLDACRRLFIIYATPGALQPRVTTIVDMIKTRVR